METPRDGAIMEIYKLHAELADRVGQRRMSAHRIYVSVLAGLLAFFGGLLGLGRLGGQDVGMAFCIVGIAGALLAWSWGRLVGSYRRLNEAKFKVLQEVEQDLPHQCFQREWDHLKVDSGVSRYVELTSAERWLPWSFLILYGSLFLLGLYRWWTAG